MLRLRTLGSVGVERDGSPLGGAAGQRRVLALLAVLAAAGERGLSRDVVLGLLWSEGEPDRARQALTQALYHARRALDTPDLFTAGGELRLDFSRIDADIHAFEQALDAGDDAAAVACYAGPFLDGFFVNGAPEFERWASAQRARYHDRCVAALRRIGERAEASGDLVGAVEAWKRLAALDPLNTAVCLKLMHALASAGDRAAALQHARVHEQLLQSELEITPDASFAELVERLRREPAASSSTTFAEPARAEHVRPPAIAANEAEAVEQPTPGRDLTPVSIAFDRRLEVSRTSVQTRRRRWAVAAGLVLAAVFGGTVVAKLREEPAELPALHDHIVVAPFRVAGAHPSLAYLKEGLVDLLATKLGGDPASRPADPSLVVSATRRDAPNDTGVPTRDRVIAIARRLGADRVVVGNVVGTPARLVISASLLGVPDADVRSQATVEGPVDSLTMLVDRLAARLILGESSERDRLASHMTTSFDALRAFLDGRASYRRGRYRDAIREFDRALELDPAFALAGLSLAQAADRLGLEGRRTAAINAAWAARSELTESDRLYLEALAGGRHPLPTPPRERLAAWERVTAAAPDRAGAWVELGERLYHDGPLLRIEDATDRARAAFLRAHELDPMLAPALQYLVQLAAQDRDTAAIRRWGREYLAVDSAGDVADFIRWRVAVALRDTAALRVARRRLLATTPATARLVTLSSLHGALDLTDAERVVGAQLERAVRTADRAELLRAQHSIATNRGRLGAARRALDRLDALTPAPPVLPEAVAAAAPPPNWRTLDAQYAAGDSVPMRRATPLPVATTERLSVDTGTPLLSTNLAEARDAVRRHSSDALRLVERLDSLAAEQPDGSDALAYLTLEVARLYAALGHVDDALASVRRRPYMSDWPPYLATQLREEGRWAASVGDTTGARRALRHYLALRADPDPALRASVDSVRAELDRLGTRAP